MLMETEAIGVPGRGPRMVRAGSPRWVRFMASWVWVAGAMGAAAQSSPDKSAYDLFHPVPVDLMREMNTDRPDKTESPYTVDAGHFQLEMDFVTYTHDRDTSGGGDTRTDAVAVAPVNLKAGLFNNVDFQLILETYNHVRVDDRRAGAVTRMSGYGDTTARLKVNFWGNDGGATAMGLLPFVKFPTSQDGLGNNAVEGGVILPYAAELPWGWDTGMMAECDFLSDEAGEGRHTSFINSITFDHQVYGKLSGYAEFFSEVSTERDARWVGTVDFGLMWQVTSNVEMDAGVNVGITKSADDVNLFTGFSWRF